MTITITKRGYWCLRVVYTSCQGLESDGRNFLAAIVLTDICRSFLRVSKVTEKMKTRSKPTPSENFNSHKL
jgi:hypothetical protein